MTSKASKKGSEKKVEPAKKGTKSTFKKNGGGVYPEYLTAAYNPTRVFPKKVGDPPSKAAEKLVEAMAENGPLLSSSIERFVSAFEKSSRRWEMVIYPVMFAFALLSGYGFYLIYSLTHDMHVMTYSITHMSSTIDNMSNKLDPIVVMGKDISKMNNNIVSLDNSVKDMSGDFRQMNKTMSTMNQSVRYLGHDMNMMSRDMGDIARPMNFFSGFMP